MWIRTMNKIEMLVNLRLIIKNISHLRTQWLYKKEIIYITGNQTMVAEKYNNEKNSYFTSYFGDWFDYLLFLIVVKYSWIIQKDVKSWLAKQAFWQVRLPPPTDIKHPHDKVTKPNQMYHFDFWLTLCTLNYFWKCLI